MNFLALHRTKLASITRRWALMLLATSGIAVCLSCSAVNAQNQQLAEGSKTETQDQDQVLDFKLDTSLEGNYLAARAAAAVRDLDAAAQFYTDALEADQNNRYLLERSFSLKAATGDIEHAQELAELLIRKDRENRLARLVLGVGALKNGQPSKARVHFKAGSQGPFADLTSAILTAWSLAGAKKTDEAIRLIDELKGPEWYGVFKAYHSGLILDLAGRKKDALERLQTAHKEDPTALRITEAYARALMRNDRQSEAIDVLMTFDKQIPDHPLISAALKSIQNGDKLEPFITTSRAGASEFLYGFGAAIGRDGAEEIGAIHLHLALYLDPDNELPLLSLSTIQGQLRNYEVAIDYLGEIKDKSPLKAMSEVQVGRYYSLLEKYDDAVKHLQVIADKNPKDIEALLALGDVQRANKKFAEAAEAYMKAEAALPRISANDWTLFYYRGISFERTKQWPKAEADFKKALELKPDEPNVLNYLGYSWIDMGLNLEEGLNLVKKAVELRPDDGYIVDSLGWAYYKLGRFEEAVQQLERAVQLRAEDPVINDHLGDGYWRVGRRLEAKFQWRHAIDLKPEPEEIPKIKAKLEKGLDDLPAPVEAKTEVPEQPKAQ